jgi:hypothetical protein
MRKPSEGRCEMRTETLEQAQYLLRTYGSLVVIRTSAEPWLQVATGHGHADRTEGAWGYGRVGGEGR